jgi:hypothetical protein
VFPPLARSTAEAIIGFLVIAAVLIAYRQFVLKRQLERFEKPTPDDREAEDEDHGEDTDSTEDAGPSPAEAGGKQPESDDDEPR